MTTPGVIRHAGLAITPWKNGAGRKADIAAGPGWTLGYAWLDQDAPFSDYSGHDRTITLVEGPGFELVERFGHVLIRLDAPYAPADFDGAATVHCHLLGGTCRVINVMTERAISSHAVEIIRESGRTVAALTTGATRMLVALAGWVKVSTSGGTLLLERFDTVAVTEDVLVTFPTGGVAGLFTLTPRIPVS